MSALERPPSTARLTGAGIARLITVLVTLVVTAVAFFLAAGTPAVERAWIYYGALLGYLVVGMTVIAVFFPQAIDTVNARGRVNKDVKSWDKAFGAAYTVLLLIQPAVAGWDVRVGRAYDLPWPIHVLAIVGTIAAYAFVHWAMVVNRHAETGVRIQGERHHVVVCTGPYRIVRHPFYISLILTHLLYPLALGSWSSLVPGVIIAVLFVWRTAREDETLRRELEGYEAFTKRTRYRLAPGVW